MTSERKPQPRVLRMLERMARMAPQGQLTPRQLSLLYRLSPDAPRTIRALADELELSRPTVSRCCDRLQAGGLVERYPDPEDGRSVLVSPTALGLVAMDYLDGRGCEMPVITIDTKRLTGADAVARMIGDLGSPPAPAIRRQRTAALAPRQKERAA